MFLFISSLWRVFIVFFVFAVPSVGHGNHVHFDFVVPLACAFVSAFASLLRFLLAYALHAPRYWRCLHAEYFCCFTCSSWFIEARPQRRGGWHAPSCRQSSWYVEVILFLGTPVSSGSIVVAPRQGSPRAMVNCQTGKRNGKIIWTWPIPHGTSHQWVQKPATLFWT